MRILAVASQEGHLHLGWQSRSLEHSRELVHPCKAHLSRCLNLNQSWEERDNQCILSDLAPNLCPVPPEQHKQTCSQLFLQRQVRWGCISWCISTAANIFTLHPYPWIRPAACIRKCFAAIDISITAHCRVWTKSYAGRRSNSWNPMKVLNSAAS